MNKGVQRSAFTLIELLVVIAIIAILAAILFPVFAQARDNARKITSVSNLKEQTLAMIMYTQDYDEKVCPSLGWGDDNIGLIQWQVAIAPYVKNGQEKTHTSNQQDPFFTGIDDKSIFVSPNWKKSAPSADAKGNTLKSICADCSTTPTVARYSYGMNQKLTSIFYLTDASNGGCASWVPTNLLAGQEGCRVGALAEFGTPANLVLLTESFDSPFNLTGVTAPDVSWMEVQDRYSGTTTIVSLVDGHVKTVKGSSTMYSTVSYGPSPAECMSWWGGEQNDIQGSSVAVCAKTRPDASIYFGPRAGR